MICQEVYINIVTDKQVESQMLMLTYLLHGAESFLRS